MVGNSAGVDAATTFSLDVVDLTGLQPDLGANEGGIRVTVCAVVASCVKDAAEVRPPGDNEVKLLPMAGPGSLQGTLCSSLPWK